MNVKLPKALWVFLLLAGIQRGSSQELHATVTVISSRVRTTDPKVFQTLQSAIAEFLNTRKWTDDDFGQTERIECNFVLNVSGEPSTSQYSASLTVQSVRPVYNSGYSSNMLNYMDNDISFKYIQYQALDFSDSRVSGDDPDVSNLTAILAYYAYLIIGLDYDSYSPRGGETYFKKAQNIVNNAPEDSKNINGWKPFESNLNRYWLVDNLLNSRLSRFHDVLYQYNRMGLDKMYSDMNAGRASIIDCLNILSAINSDNPTTMILQVFFTTKSDELTNIFSQGPIQDRERAVQLLTQLDPSNASKYQEDIK